MESIGTEEAPRAIGPYAQAVRAGDWLYCSGQIALDPETGELVPGGIAEETDRVLRNLAAVLDEAGASLRDVVKATVYLADLDDFQAMNEVYGRHLDGHRPARAAVEVARLPRGALVEVDAVAYLG